MLQGIEKKIKVDVQAAKDAYQGLGVTASFFSFFQGRATFFAIFFAVCGTVGFFLHYDLTSYALLAGAVFTGVVGHSLKEDYFEMRHRNLEQSKSAPPDSAAIQSKDARQ